MKITKKYLSFLMVFIMMIFLGPWLITIAAQEVGEGVTSRIVYSGKSGALNWSIDEDGKLTICGNGDYEPVPLENHGVLVPEWIHYASAVKSAELRVTEITSTANMFYTCRNLENISFLQFDTSMITNMTNMFCDCSGLKSIDLSNFNTENVESMNGMFSGCSDLENLDVQYFSTTNVIVMSNMFYGCSSLTSLDVSGFDTSNVTQMSAMFGKCSNLTSLDVSNFNTSNVTHMPEMFMECSSLTNLDISGLDTSNVTDMWMMFARCSALTDLDVSGFNTKNVNEMGGMFMGCSGLLNLDISGFNTSNVKGNMYRDTTGMSSMFSFCSSLEYLDVSNFDTSNVIKMKDMFSFCSNLTSLDVSGFDTSNVTTMEWMFCECEKLTSLDVSRFDTSKVTDMSRMFADCISLSSLDISGFNTSNVLRFDCMFFNSAVKTADFSGWDFSKSDIAHETFIGFSEDGFDTIIVPANLPCSFWVLGAKWINENGIISSEIPVGIPTVMTYQRTDGVSDFSLAETASGSVGQMIQLEGNMNLLDGVALSDVIQYINWTVSDQEVASFVSVITQSALQTDPGAYTVNVQLHSPGTAEIKGVMFWSKRTVTCKVNVTEQQESEDNTGDIPSDDAATDSGDDSSANTGSGGNPSTGEDHSTDNGSSPGNNGSSIGRYPSTGNNNSSGSSTSASGNIPSGSSSSMGNVSTDSNQSPSLAGTNTITVINPDGSTTTTTVTTDESGKIIRTEEITTEQISTETVKITDIIRTDRGTERKETTTQQNKDGSTVVKEVAVSAESKVTTTTTTTKADGSVIKVRKDTDINSKGNRVEHTVTTKMDHRGAITRISEKSWIPQIAFQTSATITVKKDGNGREIHTEASVNRTTNGKRAMLTGNIISQITEAANQTNVMITMTVQDSAGNNQYKVMAFANDLIPGNQLFLYRKKVSTGEYIAVNAKTYTVNKSGSIAVNMSENRLYELVNQSQAEEISKKMISCVKMKKDTASMKQGEKIKCTLSSSLNPDNIKSIRYLSSSSKTASVSKDGRIKAKKPGTVIIQAKVTLKNGAYKKVSMKVKVK